jgi:hypothetical protein
MTRLGASISALAFTLGCGKSAITETRMIHAPARAPDCPLELVEVDITAFDFNRTWDVLGYVGLHDDAVQDPAAEENRRLVRPRACAMGGTSIAVAQNTASTTMLGQTGSGLTYMVLRPKSPAAPPAAF